MNKYVLGLLLAIPLPARALTFNVTYDPSVASAPAGFTSAFSNALQAFTNAYSDPIQINLSVGWGEVAGSSLAPGNLGQSFASERGFTYTPVRTALIRCYVGQRCDRGSRLGRVRSNQWRVVRDVEC